MFFSAKMYAWNIHYSETTGGYENYIVEKRKFMCIFPRICGIGPNLKIILPDLCVVNIIDKLFEALCCWFCAI